MMQSWKLFSSASSQAKKEKEKKEYVVHAIFSRRQQQGEYYNLLQEMCMADPQSHFRHNIYIYIYVYIYITVKNEWLLDQSFSCLSFMPLHMSWSCGVLHCHCRKKRIIMTNFGYLSCTQYCCKPLGKACKKCTCTQI